jgi:glucosamine--fructose-6-phosphate aminotransferase (isomerizing)
VHLEREIREQADVLAARAAPGRDHAERAAALLRRPGVDYLIVAARGSSDNAARYAQYLLGAQARLPVGLAAPWLYGRGRPPLLHGGAVLAISQSGRSPDVTGVVAAAREQGRPAIVITNEPESPMASVADVVVPLLVDSERSVAATKTYAASLHAVAQIADALVGLEPFDRLVDVLRSTADEQLGSRDRFDRLGDASFITAVGRGLEYATAHETALKLRELTGIPAEALSPPDLMHGPVAALGPTGWLWGVEPGRDLLDAVAARGTPAVIVSHDDALLDAAQVPVRVPAGLPGWAQPIVSVVPGQAAALRLAELRGVDVDAPHGLAKVTLTS